MEQAFGEYLKTLREDQNLSISQLSQAAGISGSQISRIENGLRGIPKPQTLRKLAEALQAPYEEMMQAAGYWEDLQSSEDEDKLVIPEWATNKDKRDFKHLLEDDGELMFDGIPLDQEDKQRIKDVLTGLLWEAKKMNKRGRNKP
ncbi:helix-turn-helix domain-containing protein [Paenibacillus sp. F411]|uniref:helix-turn-helix domain-containing protein n=1 Tax=Paenibacillus sp. F411 TaxID=2820239 RepID=UPI001AAF8C2E|nr:helix-turn-helix domain-containing protein [Paenibacillus sp. F411]